MDPTAGARIRALVSVPTIHDSLKIYMSEKLPAELVELGFYTADNAETWLVVDEFLAWLARRAQMAPTTPLTPSHSGPSPSQPSLPPITPSSPPPLPAQTRATVLSSSENTASTSKRKRPRPQDDDSDSDDHAPPKRGPGGQGKTRNKLSKRADPTRTIDISRETAVVRSRRGPTQMLPLGISRSMVTASRLSGISLNTSGMERERARSP
uniref:Uncharacterized protein n=1 Tax=Mycena chlorophos TaxID=658473 RepID=A0ABQ0L669_MYCCL|nr:predicted protein [Mycena chlorophos]